MEELIEALEKLKGHDDFLEERIEGYFRRYYDSKHAEVKAAESLACKYLINETGGCDWNNIDLLRSKGYRVCKGEGDSFGWLSGCITIETVNHTPHVLVYG